MSKKSHWIAVIIIVVGFLMLFNRNMNLLTAAALILLTVGMLQIRKGETKKGYRYLGVGAALLLLDNLMIVFIIVLASLAYFYSKNKKIHLHDDVMKKQNFMARYYWDQSSWRLRSMSLWHAIGEVNADLSQEKQKKKKTNK